ncbi:MAG TPA: serine/threonine-protein kinase [Kofleriaceae bacterium]|nr:serine/threonine-protein kinase [Kofleriaceae bacterium]
MDRTNREGDEAAPGLDDTLPSGEYAAKEPAPKRKPTSLDDTQLSDEQSLTKDSSGRRPPQVPVERGTVIGRYTVIEPIGSGTMGLVVAAFDPTLDRKVAIKLVQLDPTGTTSGRQRLMREAQAMAKLQHPNVVTVFEVGTFEDRVFLAMEYVAGSTLAEWLAQTRSQREIASAFAAAGQGLAAAHRAGIVHRDFKPANVLVGKDGRVRVADFGLATAVTDAPPPPVAVSRDSDPGPLGMTKTGAVLGTPAYMSPEQHRGQTADARADQFSFCVALYEALYKQLPFEGSTFLVYQENVLAGRMREAPKSDIPARIQRALRRGMALSPGDRYPDMDALLDELSRDRAAAYRRAAVIGGAAALAATVAFAAARSTTSSEPDPCAAAEQPLGDVWTADQRKAVEASFHASGSPGANTAFERVAKLLDDRVKGLRAARRDACVATAVRHEQSPELLDRRMQCVDQGAAATRALIAVMSEAHDVSALMKSIDAAGALAPVEACADRAALMSEIPLPPQAIRPQVDALSHGLDRAEAMENAGLYPKALAELDKIVGETDKLAFAPLRARAHFLAANAHVQLENNQQGAAELRKSAELAAEARDDKLSARAWIALLGVTGYRLGQYDEAKGIEAAAAAAVVRAGNDGNLTGKLENSRGLIALGRDEYLPAADHFRAAAAAQEKLGRSSMSEVARSLNNAGTALTWAGKFEDAKAAHEKALAMRIEMLGTEHPDVADSYHGLGILYDETGKPEEALAQFEKSAAITAKAYPPDSSHIAKALVSLGLVYGELERNDEALDNMKRALEIFEKHPDDNVQYMSTVLYDLGLAYLSAHQPKEATATLLRGLDAATAAHGADSLQAASALGGLLVATGAAGDLVKAKEYGERSLAISEKKLGPDHENVARTLGDLAENANQRHAPKDAMKLIDRALAIIEKPGAPELAVRFEMHRIRASAELQLNRAPDALADAKLARDGYAGAKQPSAVAATQLVVADALWLLGGAHKQEAIAEVKAALETIQAQPKPDAETLAAAQAWLAKHP